MRILSIDTSFSFFNLSIVEDGRLTLLYYLDSPKKTLENLPKVLEELKIDPKDYDAYAISRGIGYLTSVRIGITFVKAWAYLYKKPVVGYENLELMALYTPTPPPKIVCLRVSNTLFYREKTEEALSPIKSSKSAPKGNVISLKHQGIEGTFLALDFFPFSAYGGLYAYEKLSSGFSGDDPFLLEPVYVSEPV